MGSQVLAVCRRGRDHVQISSERRHGGPGISCPGGSTWRDLPHRTAAVCVNSLKLTAVHVEGVDDHRPSTPYHLTTNQPPRNRTMKACAFVAALVACVAPSSAFVAPLQSSALTFSSPRSSLAAAAAATATTTAVSHVYGISRGHREHANTPVEARSWVFAPGWCPAAQRCNPSFY